VGGDLAIQFNKKLVDISSLMGLKSIGGSLDIIYNSNLSSLNGLDSIDSETIEGLDVEVNTDLCHCM